MGPSDQKRGEISPLPPSCASAEDRKVHTEKVGSDEYQMHYIPINSNYELYKLPGIAGQAMTLSSAELAPSTESIGLLQERFFFTRSNAKRNGNRFC